MSDSLTERTAQGTAGPNKGLNDHLVEMVKDVPLVGQPIKAVHDTAKDYGQANQEGTPGFMDAVTDEPMQSAYMQKAFLDFFVGGGMALGQAKRLYLDLITSGISPQRIDAFTAQIQGLNPGTASIKEWATIAAAALVARKATRGTFAVDATTTIMRQLGERQRFNPNTIRRVYERLVGKTNDATGIANNVWDGIVAALRGNGNALELAQEVEGIVASILNPATPGLAMANELADTRAMSGFAIREFEQYMMAAMKDINTHLYEVQQALLQKWGPAIAHMPIFNRLVMLARIVMATGIGLNAVSQVTGGSGVQADDASGATRTAQLGDIAKDMSGLAGDIATSAGQWPGVGTTDKEKAQMGTSQLQNRDLNGPAKAGLGQMNQRAKGQGAYNATALESLKKLVAYANNLDQQLGIGLFDSNNKGQGLLAQTMASSKESVAKMLGYNEFSGQGEFSNLGSVNMISPSEAHDAGQTMMETVTQTRQLLEEYIDVTGRITAVLNSISDPKYRDWVAAEVGLTRGTLQRFAAMKAIEQSLKNSIRELDALTVAATEMIATLPHIVMISTLEIQIKSAERQKAAREAWYKDGGILGQWGVEMVGDHQRAQPSRRLYNLYENIIFVIEQAQTKLGMVLGQLPKGYMTAGIAQAVYNRIATFDNSKQLAIQKQDELVGNAFASITGMGPGGVGNIALSMTDDGLVTVRRAMIIDDDADIDVIADEEIERYFDELLPGFGTLLEHPDEYRGKTVEEVDESRKRKHHKKCDD